MHFVSLSELVRVSPQRQCIGQYSYNLDTGACSVRVRCTWVSWRRRRHWHTHPPRRRHAITCATTHSALCPQPRSYGSTSRDSRRERWWFRPRQLGDHPSPPCFLSLHTLAFPSSPLERGPIAFVALAEAPVYTRREDELSTWVGCRGYWRNGHRGATLRPTGIR